MVEISIRIEMCMVLLQSEATDEGERWCMGGSNYRNLLNSFPLIWPTHGAVADNDLVITNDIPRLAEKWLAVHKFLCIYFCAYTFVHIHFLWNTFLISSCFEFEWIGQCEIKLDQSVGALSLGSTFFNLCEFSWKLCAMYNTSLSLIGWLSKIEIGLDQKVEDYPRVRLC